MRQFADTTSTMVNSIITYTPSMHNQPPKSPPDKSGCTTCQGDFRNFSKVEVVGKCPLICLIHHKLKAQKEVQG